MKHTPGPWTLRESPMGDGMSIVEAKVDNEFPYNLDVCGDDYTGFGDIEQRHANMRLIAAAPELLDALKMGVLFVDSIMPQLGRVACDIGLLNEFLCSARPAIQKAEGEKP